MSESDRQTTLAMKVLVLNRSYMAVHIASAKRAFNLLWLERAEVIDFEDGQYANYDLESWLELSELRSYEKSPHDDWIRITGGSLQIPRIIRLHDFNKTPARAVRFSRRNLLARDSYVCQYCAKRFSPSLLTMDHVIPRSQGGVTTWENIVSACVKCNTRKGCRTPKEAGMKLLKEPVRPKSSPIVAAQLQSPKYTSWRAFIRTSRKAGVSRY
ncbi:MAG: HNH endonuclease [Pirellulaceae bacterium]|nr:HNH endonuclease [Pirellulaceae bacterium]